jgi:hypothetical protein
VLVLDLALCVLDIYELDELCSCSSSSFTILARAKAPHMHVSIACLENDQDVTTWPDELSVECVQIAWLFSLALQE